MKKFLLLIIFQFFLHTVGKSQDETIDFSILQKESTSLCQAGRYQEALSIFDVKKKQIEYLSEDLQLEFFLARYSILKCILSYKKNYDLYNYIIESIDKIEQLKGSPDTSLIEIYLSLGNALYNALKYQDAEKLYDKAIGVYVNNPQFKDHLLIANTFYNASKNSIRKGDIEKALTHSHKALAFTEKHFNENDPITGNIMEVIGTCYHKLSNFSKSKFYYEKALSIFRNSVGENTSNTSRIYDRLGRLHITFDKYEIAIQYFKKSLSIRESLFESTDFKIGESNDNIGNSFYYLGKYDKALMFFNKALTTFRYSASKATIADQYSKIAACYTNLKEFNVANSYMDSCFEILKFNWKASHPFEEYKSSHTHLLITLYFKAKNHQKAYEAGWGKKELYKAARWFDLCIELIEYINSTFEESGSKKYLLDRFYYIFEAAINSNYHLYQETDSLRYIEQAFGYAERSKALLLKEAMQMADANVEFGIPQSLLDEERRLKKAIIEKENRRYESQQAPEGEQGQAIHQINNEIFTLKQSYRDLMDRIQQQYPKAHRLRYVSSPMTPTQVQKELLAPGQALVQYFLGEEHLFLFVISSEEVVLAKRPVEKGLPEVIHGFRESIYGWSQSQEDSLAQQYVDFGYQLYQNLIQPIAPLLPKHLIIIPDGLLEYVPFEALLLEPDREASSSAFDAYPYLIRNYQISYAHSARLLQEMKTADEEAPRQWILAFAPYFQDPPDLETSLVSRRRNLGRLTSNVKEVQAIKSLLRTRIYKGNDATRERFMADAPHYGIIHLATHAKANDEEGEYSYLAFTEIPDTLQNEFLYAKDLYSMRLKADMVVLSACESGIGELRRGEGVISLARGFSYAGAKSLVTTLWRVSDRESAALMQLFYQHLKEGRPKDEALRAAKLQFISRGNTARAHPFFWAAFILSGDTGSIEVNGQTFPNWVYVLLIGLFVFLALRFAKRKPI